MTGRPRAAVAALPAYRPGRSAEAVAAEHGLAEAVKLASNELPYGPLPSVAAALTTATATVARYPDHGAVALRTELADALGLELDQVTVGAGSAGILHQVMLAYVERGDRVAMCWPSFEAYPIFAALVDGEQVCVPLVDETFDLPALAAAIDDRTKVAFVTNPNNPTGTVVGTDEIIAFLDRIPRSCLVVLDEAYSEFVTDPRVTDSTELVARHPNLLVTRTFSKAHGLASLRIGYAFANAGVIATVDRTLIPFAVNGLAQAAARASLAAADEMKERVARVVAERDRVTEILRKRGWSVPDAQGNFIWLPVREDAAPLGRALEQFGVVGRAFADVGLRVTIGDPTENDRFLDALERARQATS